MLLGLLVSAAAIVVASLVVGQAVLSACGRVGLTALAGPVGLAALLAVAGTAARLPGDALTALACEGALVVASAWLLARGGAVGRLRRAGVGAVGPAMAAAGLAALAASIPFVAAWQVGVLGVGLVNDDMASHLLIASWLDEGFAPEPVFVDQGYPLGPHGLVAAIAAALPGSAGLIEAFAGLVVAIPALTALTAYAALGRLRTGVATLEAPARAAVAALVALPYLAAAYLAQEAFKEPIEALLLLGFVLLLPGVRGARDGVPLGLLAVGSLHVYSFPGLSWMLGAALAYAAVALWGARGSAESRRALMTRMAAPLAIALAVVVIGSAPEWARLADFADFRALDADRANDGGLGNLRGHISPLEALGIWPTSEFRLAAGAGSLPAVAFYAGALVALAAFATGLPRWIRRHGAAVPAALVAALAIFLAARLFGTVYTSAKALAIASPLIMLIALGGLLGGPRGLEEGRGARGHRVRLALAAALIAGGALSSFLILRQAPVGPREHMDELAQIRPAVEGEKALFLGRDNFVLYELRGSKPFTHVRHYFDPYFVRPNFELQRVASKFDFDSVPARTLARFPYVITTRAAYASGPPPGYEAVEQTQAYVLWRRGGPVQERRTLAEAERPGATFECGDGGRAPEDHQRTAGSAGETGGSAGETAAVLPDAPVSAAQGAWSPAATIEGGAAATQRLRLSPGRWLVSIQYDSTRPLTVAGPGLETTLPANLDFRGPGPFWPAGELRVDGEGAVPLTAEVDEPPLAGRLLGASSVAHLGAIAATPAGRGYADAAEPSPGAGERLVPAGRVCGRYVDWIAPAEARDRRPGAGLSSPP